MGHRRQGFHLWLISSVRHLSLSSLFSVRRRLHDCLRHLTVEEMHRPAAAFSTFDQNLIYPTSQIAVRRSFEVKLINHHHKSSVITRRRMVLFWCRTKQAQLRALSNQFKRCYFQIHGPSSVIRETKIGVLNSPNLASQRSGLDSVRFFAAPVQVKPKYEDKDKGRPRMNEQISAQYVRLVTDEGHGVVSRHEALDRARRLNVDLVEVQPDGNPPVCKLMDYNREMYVRQVKEKEQTKKKSDLVLRKGALKEVRITCKIDKNDLQTKADTVKRLAERGHRIKCMAVGTEDQDLGGLLSRLSALIDEFSLVESGPRVEAKQAYIVVRHIKFGPLKKGPGKKKVLATPNDSTNPPEKTDESDSETEEDSAIVESDDFENKIQDPLMKFAPETSSNRYASTKQPNVPENRYATTRPVNGRRLEPESQNPRRQGSGEAETGGRPVEVNRYKKGPPSPPPSRRF